MKVFLGLAVVLLAGACCSALEMEEEEEERVHTPSHAMCQLHCRPDVGKCVKVGNSYVCIPRVPGGRYMPKIRGVLRLRPWKKSVWRKRFSTPVWRKRFSTPVWRKRFSTPVWRKRFSPIWRKRFSPSWKDDIKEEEQEDVDEEEQETEQEEEEKGLYAPSYGSFAYGRPSYGAFTTRRFGYGYGAAFPYGRVALPYAQPYFFRHGYAY
jgi:hypothetical protein